MLSYMYMMNTFADLSSKAILKFCLQLCVSFSQGPHDYGFSDTFEDLDLRAQISFVSFDSTLSCDLLLWYSKCFLNNAILVLYDWAKTK